MLVPESPSCPATGASHEFRSPRKGDSRSPCPALNTMANHGYISRNGKQITAWEIVVGLQACYGLTLPLSIFLSYTAFLVLRNFGPIDLYHIGRHNIIEHNASLVHIDTPAGQTYAPIGIDRHLLDTFVKDARGEMEVEVEVDGKKERQNQVLLTIADVGRARVRREKQSPLTSIRARIARGEMAIIMGVWEKKTAKVTGVPIDWIERWLWEERLPEGWRPSKAVGMFETIQRGNGILSAATAIREAEKAKKD